MGILCLLPLMLFYPPIQGGFTAQKLSEEFIEKSAVLPANSGGIHSAEMSILATIMLFSPPIQGGFTAK